MIVKTTKEINGIVYDCTYSDIGMMIERDGNLYVDAIDPVGVNRQYTETDVPIEVVNLTETEQKALAYDIITGVAE